MKTSNWEDAGSDQRCTYSCKHEIEFFASVKMDNRKRKEKSPDIH